jgi:hypothetical protein
MAKDRKKVKARQNLAKTIERKAAPKLGPTPQQDLQLLDRVSGLAPLERQVHIQVQQSIARLGRALQELDILKKEKQP